MNFDSFVGNSRIIRRLQTKLREDRFPHGVIFSGPEGVGKHTLALMVAKALNCTGQRTSRDTFCGRCASCHKIDAGTHSDVLTVSVEEEASQIKISQIRQILSVLDFRPLEGTNKVFIIDPANLMNLESANALLKGLEEPPDNSFFVLITVNVHELLLTVRSRCQVYHFSPLALDDIRKHGFADELVIRWSKGSIGRAQTIDVAQLKQQRNLLLDFLETAVTADESEFRDMLAASATVARSKQDFAVHLGILSVLLADLVYAAENLPDKIVNFDIQERITRLASRAGVERLIRMGEFLGFIEKCMKNYVNRQMLTDVLALLSNDAASKILNDNAWKSR